MPANDLPLSPVDQFVSDAARVDQARASTGQPAALDPGLVRSFEKAADQYGVPVDALLAIAEKDSGFDPLARSRGPGAKTRGIISVSDADMARTGINPYVPEQAVGLAAMKLRKFLDSGMSIDDAIKAHAVGPDRATWGPQAQEYLDDISSRAKRLADTLYPPQAPQPAPEPVPEAPKSPGVIGTLNDMRVALDMGFETMIADIDGVARKVLPSSVMGAIDAIDRKLTGGKTQPELYEENKKKLDAQFSSTMRESLRKKWWDQEKGKFGDALSDWRSYAGAVAESLPESVLTSGPALKLAKGAYAAAILKGAAPAAAAKTAATVATVAGAVTEGALGGAQSEREVKEEIEKISLETLRESDAFKAMVAQGMSEDAAKHALIHDLGTRAFITGGIATGLFGGMGDRIIAKTFLGAQAGVGGAIKNATVASVVNKGKQLGAAALGEGLAEELPQSALQQVAQNEAVQRADPKKSLMDDVINQAVGGAVTGAVMGAGMGGVFDHATRDQRAAPSQQPSGSSPGVPPSAQATEAGAGSGGPAPATPETPVAAAPVAEPPAPAVEAPSGPLARALDAGAPHLSEAAKPAGRAVVVTDELGQRIGHIVAQDAESITFRDAGGQIEEFSAQDISSGMVKIAQINEAAPAPTAPVEPGSTPLAEPVAARAEEPAEKPKKERAKKESTTGLTEAGGDMAAGITRGMYDALWKKVEAGDINENGAPSALLQAAKMVRDRGGLQTIGGFERFAQDYGKIDRGPSFQADMRALVEKHSPARTKAPDEHPISEQAAEHAKRLAPEQPRPLTDLSEPELRQHLKDIATQAKAAGGWNKMFIAKRREIEAAIAASKVKAKKGNADAASEIDGEKWWSSLSTDDRAKVVKASGYAVGGPGVPWSAMSPAARERVLAARSAASDGPSDMQKFPKESGTLGIPRDEMPQVPTEAHGGLVRHLNAQGIEHETKMVDAAELKPTQAEFSPSKVEAAKEAEGDRAVIVSNDGHIIDGHHQAVAAQEEGEQVKAIVLDAPVKEALEAVKNSPSAQRAAEEASGAVRDAQSIARNELPVEDDRERQRQENVRKLEEQEKAAEAAPEPKAEAPAEPEKQAYGASNKLVSADRAAELRARLKQKLKDAGVTMNSGIDPETLVIGAELAVFHIEAGTRAFADFARTMAADLGASIAALRPYLRSWYNGARDMMEDHGHDISGLDSPEKVRSELARVVAESEKVDAKPAVNEIPAKEKEPKDGWAAIHEEGAGPLAEVAPANDEATPRGGDAERQSAASEQSGSGAGGESDGARPATARGRGDRAARNDSSAAGEREPVMLRIRDEIHRIIDSILPAGSVGVSVTPRLEPVHDAAMERAGGESGTRPYGLYSGDPVGRMIYVSLESPDPKNTTFHEAWHAAQELGLATKQELAVLRSPAEVRRLKKFAAEAGYAPETMSQIELEANFFGMYLSAMEQRAEAPQASPSTMGVADRLLRLLRRIRNFLAGHGFQTVEDIADRFRSGEMGQRPFWNWTGDRLRSSENAFQAAPATAPAAKGGLYAKASQRATDFLTSVMVGTKGSSDTVGKFSGLALVPTRPLFMELTRGMQSARDYLATKQAMDAMRNHWFTVAHETIDRWQKFAVKNRDENRALMDIMHESTLSQVDPSKDFESHLTREQTLTLANRNATPDDTEAAMRAKAQDDARRAAYKDLKQRYAGLSDAAKGLYNEVRDAYATMADEGEKQVVANIQKALDQMIRKAEQAHADELRRIADEGLSGQERDDAIAAADARLTMVKTRQRRQRAARVKSMRSEFEANRLKGPYFPLSRFGNYFVTVRNDAGEVQSFSRFEKRREQRIFADDMRKQGLKVEEGVASAKGSLERNIDPKFVGEVEAILDGAGAPEAVRDAIWQKYLETLPDFSIRKHRIHRKGRAGFNPDAMRAFAHNMFHGSHQLARLTYGQDLQEYIDEARRQARDADDPVRAQAVVNEMVLRHDFIMNPKAAPWSHALSSFAFVWTMGANISSAIVNLDQAVTKGIPYLAYDPQTKAGMAKATTETMRAMRDFTVGKGTVESANLTADEKAAVRVGYDSGLIDRTQAHDVAGVAETGVEYSPWRNRIMRLLAWPMHQTERFNREVTFLAGYRIARDAGLSHQEAIAKASDLTWMTHFDNQSTSKPRFMSGDVGRVAFALKGFQANLLYRLFRDLHQTMQGESPEAKKAALGRFAASIALTGAAAGIKGTAFYSILMILAGAAMGLAGSEDDPEESLRKWVLDHVGDSVIGQAVGGMMMDGVPGYLTGTSLSGRLGMSDLWFRSNDRDMNSEQTWNYWLEQLGGAPLSLGHQVWKGGSEIAKGNIVRGVEQMLPAALKNPAKATRYAVEGVKDKSGDTVVENVPPQDIIKQAIGFTPAEIADRYARNNFQSNMQKRIKDDRRDAMKAAAHAREEGDEGAYSKAMVKVEEFNEKHPEYPIKSKSIRQSMRASESRSDRKEFGVDLQKSLAPYIKEATAPSIYGRQ